MAIDAAGVGTNTAELLISDGLHATNAANNSASAFTALLPDLRLFVLFVTRD